MSALGALSTGQASGSPRPSRAVIVRSPTLVHSLARAYARVGATHADVRTNVDDYARYRTDGSGVLPAYRIGEHLRWKERDVYARGLTVMPRDTQKWAPAHMGGSISCGASYAAALHSAYSASSAATARPAAFGTRCPYVR